MWVISLLLFSNRVHVHKFMEINLMWVISNCFYRCLPDLVDFSNLITILPDLVDFYLIRIWFLSSLGYGNQLDVGHFKLFL